MGIEGEEVEEAEGLEGGQGEEEDHRAEALGDLEDKI